MFPAHATRFACIYRICVTLAVSSVWILRGIPNPPQALDKWAGRALYKLSAPRNTISLPNLMEEVEFE